MATLLTNLKVFAGSAIHENATVKIEQGLIAAIETSQQISSRKEDRIIEFTSEHLLVPGFIDLHVHGANGSDVMDASVESLANISKTLAKEGTTSFLATTMTASSEDLNKVMQVIQDFKAAQFQQPVSGAQLLGVHLEGPFLSDKKVGAQRADQILKPQIELIEAWQALSNQAIKLVTLAPELADSLEVIEYLTQNNIIAAMGHTDATYAEAIAAIDAGCSYATHLFNAMRAIHQREPGPITAALLSDSVMAELILDGHHLHPAIVQLALRLKGIDNLVLVTDAMRAKCMKQGVYDLGGQDVIVENGMAKLKDGTLAGSVLTMNSALANLIKFSGCSLSEALKLTSENPAKKLGIFDKKGSIAIGKEADLVVLDKDFNAVLTLRQGEVIFAADH